MPDSFVTLLFKDCKSGGYNLEASHAADERLTSLVLLMIPIAYSCSVLQGKKLKQRGVQKYICRVQELKRIHRRHSSFWMGLYGQLWVAGMEIWSTLTTQLMQLKPHKLNYFKQGSGL